MPLPEPLASRLRLPVVAAPLFLVSGPELVIAACRAGVLGAFPALNQRTTEGLISWLEQIDGALSASDAPYAVNLIVHATNTRLAADLEAVVARKVPVVITSLGAVPDVVEAVHSYGGLVLHDVTTLRHAQKAADARVDGLILVSAGAGGHAGTTNPFALMASVRPWFDGIVALAGGITSGADVLAAQALGADLAYMGTRFVATAESRASDDYRRQIVEAGAADIVYTPEVSSIPANFLAASLAAAGDQTRDEYTAWRDIWSAGHGVAGIHDIPTVDELVRRLAVEYDEARARVG
ncbi:nitronate monooxygenase [Tessaracoccus sp. MC1865]|uniref:NAD(P)H-dependent flavin oxidoreductase n=1 Tax=unclassified Tessaracoccus TaxID=2635419 RepID=UPI0015FF8092|nr:MULTISPECIES: nitronate monooxygenase [unclassified Tessaracoccus]MBB1483902.1 nitronate monooxygenase [Tessaracoccus sp. MC1865]MBB1508588.1 nitronate monooxygenase [Tessaracoccus sp. MC1756]QTO36954.1 nitronate monooxygenase [Tessaracoccus sp. MC1865]